MANINFTNPYFWRSLYYDIRCQRRSQVVALAINLNTSEVSIENIDLSDFGKKVIQSDRYQETDDYNVKPSQQTPVEYLKANPQTIATIISIYRHKNMQPRSTMIVGGTLEDFVNTAMDFTKKYKFNDN